MKALVRYLFAKSRLIGILRKFSSVKIARKDYDILIVGAGPVGASLACALGNAQYSLNFQSLHTSHIFFENCAC